MNITLANPRKNIYTEIGLFLIKPPWLLCLQELYLFIFKSTIFAFHYAVFRFVPLRFLSFVFVSFRLFLFRFVLIVFRFVLIAFRSVGLRFRFSFLTFVQPTCQATTKVFCVLKMKFLFSKFHQDPLIGDIGSNLLLLYPLFHIPHIITVEIFK